MYFSKLQNVFVLKVFNVFVPRVTVSVGDLRSLIEFISDFSKNIFVQIAKCIFPNFKMYLSKVLNVFVTRVIAIDSKRGRSSQPN